jgi:nitrate reductase cytochrome c-type subunit
MNKKTVLYALLSVIVAIAYFLKNNKKEVSSNKLPAEISSTETKKDTAGLETLIVKDKYLPTSTTNQLVMHQILHYPIMKNTNKLNGCSTKPKPLAEEVLISKDLFLFRTLW